MKKLIIISAVVILIPAFLFAQSEVTIDSLIIKGKAQLHETLNSWQEQDLISVRAFFERLQNDSSYSWLINYYIALADHRLVSFYFSKNNKDRAKIYIDDGIEHLKSSIELKADFAEAHSLLSSFYGNKIGTNPLLGITLGPKSGTAISEAMKLEPQNPRTQLIAGLGAYFTPKMFGGGKEKAKAYLEQAIIYFDSTKVDNPILPDWGHDEVFAWLGLLNMENEEFEAAQSNFDRALAINPDYGWVKYVLIPDLQKRVSEKKSK